MHYYRGVTKAKHIHLLDFKLTNQ